MNRPWLIWTLFLLCLAAVALPMAWLTLKALELDRAQALARRRAALEENLNLALWRMDTLLMPLLAQEATRPASAFQTLAQVPAAEHPQRTRTVLSPLTRQTSPHVLLHFQAARDDVWTSPQAPAGRARELAIQMGLDPSALGVNETRLRALRAVLSYDKLLRETPAEMLPSTDAEALAWDDASLDSSSAGAQVVANPYAYDTPQQAAPEPSIDNSSSDPAVQDNQRFTQNSAFKGQNDLNLRNRALQTYAQQQARGQRSQVAEPPPSPSVREGVSRAFWIGDKLILARRVQVGEETVVQGCWLDWPSIERRLHQEVSDLLPQFVLHPLRGDADPTSGALATLPVQIEAALPPASGAAWSPIRLSLIVAWVCLAVAAVAIAGLLAGVISLSERRAAFVAAVTHELRTPLTTFRMYSEMLAQGMAPAEKRQQYLETLQTEADRLTHLVENVLSYARLERGRNGGPRVQTTLHDLVGQNMTRMADRAAQAELTLTADFDAGSRTTPFVVDPHAVGQILFNLVDNAAKYAAQADNRRIELSCRITGKTGEIAIRDHGPGLTAAQRRRLFRPFSKTVEEAAVTAPGVGLGLALCRRLAHDLGGSLELALGNGDGAAFVLRLPVAAAHLAQPAETESLANAMR
jgi:signal transduction histidine kinase